MLVKKILLWISKNRLEVLILLTILIVSLSLRIYRIDEYMTFLGDEGRDALMIKRILTTGDIPLIGPPTSIGNMYLGPLYYYMMTIPMAIFWLNPVAAAAMVAFLGTLSVLLLFYLTREWFGKVSALVVAFLFALSPLLIIYSRSSWNPNPAPFFSLLAVASLYWMRKFKDNRFLILTAVSLAFLVQMHYLALIMFGAIGLLWIFELVKNWQSKKNFLKNSLIALAVFCFLMSPLLVFDLRHNFINSSSILTFFTNRQETVNLNSLNTLQRVWPILFDKFLFRFIGGQNMLVTLFMCVLMIGVTAGFIYKFFKNKNIKYLDDNWARFALVIWFLVGILGISLYKQNVYDHYLLFLAPVPFIAVGSFIGYFKGRMQIVAAILLVSVLGYVNLQISPVKQPPNRQLQRTQNVAKYIIERAENKPFNFALISKHNYDSAYQFYLDVYGFKPKVVPDEITKQLFVVCEDPVCDPVNSAKYEIAGFGWTKVDTEDVVQGVRVYKLTHNNVVKKIPL